MSIEKDKKPIDSATRLTGSIAIRIEQKRNMKEYTLGRHWTHESIFVSAINRESIDLLKEHFRDEVPKEVSLASCASLSDASLSLMLLSPLLLSSAFSSAVPSSRNTSVMKVLQRFRLPPSLLFPLSPLSPLSPSLRNAFSLVVFLCLLFHLFSFISLFSPSLAPCCDEVEKASR